MIYLPELRHVLIMHNVGYHGAIPELYDSIQTTTSIGKSASLCSSIMLWCRDLSCIIIVCLSGTVWTFLLCICWPVYMCVAVPRFENLLVENKEVFTVPFCSGRASWKSQTNTGVYNTGFIRLYGRNIEASPAWPFSFAFDQC